MTHRLGLLVSLLSLAGGGCGKVPLFDVNAGFVIADVAWYAEEETLFVFWEVTAEQGLGEPSVIDLTYATDDARLDWTPVTAFTPVHTHLPVDCGREAMCGSTSLHVPLEPREVGLRLRYHREGELALEADTVFNVVGPGPAHSHRSLVVYGVFDETNQRVQWRARHQFPTLRNEQAEALGLRRPFRVRDQRYGTADLASDDNPYGYGVPCPPSFASSDLPEVGTDERAVWNPEDLPLDASDEAVVWGESTVHDATGEFTTGAVAQKNPEVRPAFPVLRSPIRDATPIQFFLEPCTRTISEDHEEMQRQRLLLEDPEVICIDHWEDADFVDSLVVALREAVEETRAAGNDMVLVIGLHQDSEGVSEAVEEALAQVVPAERERSSPRLAGAFVFDSDIRGMSLPELEPVTLWCPARLPGPQDTGYPDASTMTCAIAPENPDLELGPFTFGTLPVLPSRDQYLDFIDTYSKGQAGYVETLSFLAPEFSATADHFPIGSFGVVTFLDDEVITADADDAFSYCTGELYVLYVFRSALLQSPAFQVYLAQACAAGKVPADICATATLGLLPLELLPDWHAQMGETSYDLGLFWDFPFLLQMEYRVFVAGSVSAVGLSVPFGVGTSGESYLGSGMWTTDEFSLEELLTQCSRFCDHPTFGSEGVYHPTEDFRTTYASACYAPRYPAPGDSGFPRDP